MSAPSHTPPHPASRGRADIRLPWWALALPTLAFFTLLALILNPSEAHAATGDPAITHLLERIQALAAR
ncbi:hypothetical protein ACIPSE_20190 [Streptomyces sp. NPDC090106]|uniref:hypothetical protein n=1 Tax=Streptomyces sp. NPDC090106 TaxID=3365946 RepID=UPI0038127653